MFVVTVTIAWLLAAYNDDSNASPSGNWNNLEVRCLRLVIRIQPLKYRADDIGAKKIVDARS